MVVVVLVEFILYRIQMQIACSFESFILYFFHESITPCRRREDNAKGYR